MTPCANCGRATCPTLAPEHKGLGAPTYVQLDCERAKSAALESKIAAERRKLDEERAAWKGMQPVPQVFVAEMIAALTATGMGKPGTPNTLVDMVSEVCSELAAERARADAAERQRDDLA